MIQFFHVYKYYLNGVPALDNIHLTVDKGAFVFISGPSGAGKTTIFKLLTCEEKASSGEIHILGKKLDHLGASSIPYLRRNIGCVFQDFKLLHKKNVYENVAIPLRIIGCPGNQIRGKVQDILRSLYLAHRAESYPSELSGGEQQRVAVARALVTQPSMILADEPTGHLDEQLSRDVFKLLREINMRGATVLVATHRREIPERIPRRQIILEKGKIVYDEVIAAR